MNIYILNFDNMIEYIYIIYQKLEIYLYLFQKK